MTKLCKFIAAASANSVFKINRKNCVAAFRNILSVFRTLKHSVQYNSKNLINKACVLLVKTSGKLIDSVFQRKNSFLQNSTVLREHFLYYRKYVFFAFSCYHTKSPCALRAAVNKENCLPSFWQYSMTNFVPFDSPSQKIITKSAASTICLLRTMPAPRPYFFQSGKKCSIGTL